MRAERLFDVRGLATVVTGAASGLGLAYAEVMAENGARVTLLDRNRGALQREVERLASHRWDVRGEVCDITDRARVREAFAGAAAHYGRLDVVFANAGIDLPPGYLTGGKRDPGGGIDNLPDENWDRMIAVNLTGVFVTIREAARHMKPQGGGRIIVTTSVAASRASGLPGFAYMPAKAGAAHMVRQAALELARWDIHVNAIAPGPFATGIAGGHSLTEAAQQGAARAVPLRRMARPEEIKGAALLLASPAASYITGAEIVVDGGRMHGTADPA